MKRVVYVILSVALIGYAGLCAAMYVSQRSLIYYPQSRAVTAPESTLKLPVDGAEDLAISPDKRRVNYFGGTSLWSLS